jgi:hypothetical protein
VLIEWTCWARSLTYLVAELADFALWKRLAVQEHLDVFVKTGESFDRAIIECLGFSHFV